MHSLGLVKVTLELAKHCLECGYYYSVPSSTFLQPTVASGSHLYYLVKPPSYDETNSLRHAEVDSADKSRPKPLPKEH